MTVPLVSILSMPMPTEQELHEICSAKYERVRPYMIDQWPESIAALSFPTKLVPFDAARFSELWDESEQAARRARAVAAKLDREMGWCEWFVRLNSRSPKDVIDKPITCSGKQAAHWIRGSELCLDDTSMLHHAQAPLYVCLREPRYLHPDMEYRCFARDGEVLGLSYYFYRDRPLGPLPSADSLFTAAKTFYREHLAAHYRDVVFDLYAPGTSQETLIELNPYGLSDPCLFQTYDAVEAGGVRLPCDSGSGNGGIFNHRQMHMRLGDGHRFVTREAWLEGQPASKSGETA